MEYKHFSHVHSLAYHQTPQGAEVQCSGCNFPGTGAVFACWQCNYFLHEKCFQATRSLKHHSHPAHPLTLVPYPTYPSNSFYCDTCKLVGSGFSYSCSECDFDLHVHCAFLTPLPDQNFSSVSPPVYPNPGFPHPDPKNSYSPHSYPEPVQHSPTLNSLLASPPIPNSYQEQIQQNPTPNPLPNNSYPPHSYPGPVPHNQTMNPPPTGPHIPATYQEPVHQNPNPNPPPITTASVPAGYPGSTQHNATVSAPPPASSPIRISLLSNPLKVKEVKHFSHPHGLILNEIKETAPKICSGCDDDLTGSAYSCVDPQCNFNLHKSCFELPLEIHHKSHLDHPLKLLAKPPSHYTDNKFACNACLNSGAAFVYHCEACSFDLHIECVSLPESIIRPDHKHPLRLFYSNPAPKADEPQEVTFVCDVCQKPVHEVAWIYSCHECEFGTHLECAAYEAQPVQKTQEELDMETEIKVAMLNLLINGGLGVRP